MSASEVAWQEIWVMIVLVGLVVFLALDRFPVHIVTLFALGSVWMPGIITDKEALSGLCNSGVVVVACFLIIARVLSESKLVRRACLAVLGPTETPMRVGLLRLQIAMVALSGFLNNTPLVALMMPHVRDWARSKEIAPSKLLIPLSYSCISGGLMTMMGTSTNIIILGLLAAAQLPLPGFFSVAWIGLPLALVNIIFMQLIGHKLLPTGGGLFRSAREKTYMAEVLLNNEFFSKREETTSGAIAGQQNTPSAVAEELGLPADSLISISRPNPFATWVSTQQQGGVGGSPTQVQGSAVGGNIISSSSPPSNVIMAQSPYEPRHRSSSLKLEGVHVSDVGADHQLASELQSEASSTLEAGGPFDMRGGSARGGGGGGGGGGGQVMVSGEGSDRNTSDDDDDDDLTDDDDDGGDGYRAVPMHLLPTGHLTFEKERTIFPIHAQEPILASDRLLIACSQEDVVRLLDIPGVEVAPTQPTAGSGAAGGGGGIRASRDTGRLPSVSSVGGVADGSGHELLEVVISPGSDLLGTALHGHAFQEKYGGRVVAVRRWGDDVTSVGNTSWRPGDTALIVSRSGSESMFRKVGGFLVVTKPTKVTLRSRRRSLRWRRLCEQSLPFMLFATMVIVSATDLVPLVECAVACVLALIAAKQLRPAAIFEALDGSVLLTVAAAIGFGHSIESSGLAMRIGQGLADTGASPHQVLTIIVVLAVLLTEFVTNNAAAVIMFPVCIDISTRLSVSHTPFVMALMASSSTSFASPVGYTTNLMVFGPGGYKFVDFLRVGVPLDFLMIGTVVMLCPIMWPF